MATSQPAHISMIANRVKQVVNKGQMIDLELSDFPRLNLDPYYNGKRLRRAIIAPAVAQNWGALELSGVSTKHQPGFVIGVPSVAELASTADATAGDRLDYFLSFEIFASSPLKAPAA